jgi:antirestriction protein ArdC
MNDRGRPARMPDEHGYPFSAVDGIPAGDAASTFVVATLADIRVGGDLAGFIPSKTYITLPPAAAFKRMESYYATILHELGHWSGDETRRELSTRFN